MKMERLTNTTVEIVIPRIISFLMIELPIAFTSEVFDSSFVLQSSEYTVRFAKSDFLMLTLLEFAKAQTVCLETPIDDLICF